MVLKGKGITQSLTPSQITKPDSKVLWRKSRHEQGTSGAAELPQEQQSHHSRSNPGKSYSTAQTPQHTRLTHGHSVTSPSTIWMSSGAQNVDKAGTAVSHHQPPGAYKTILKSTFSLSSVDFQQCINCDGVICMQGSRGEQRLGSTSPGAGSGPALGRCCASILIGSARSPDLKQAGSSWLMARSTLSVFVGRLSWNY